MTPPVSARVNICLSLYLSLFSLSLLVSDLIVWSLTLKRSLIFFVILKWFLLFVGCVQKLKHQLEKAQYERDPQSRILELEHGILDIIEAGAQVWLQSGHSEKAVALYQALLEFNLFSPDFDSSGRVSNGSIPNFLTYTLGCYILGLCDEYYIPEKKCVGPMNCEFYL